jgi:hypothetical protein
MLNRVRPHGHRPRCGSSALSSASQRPAPFRPSCSCTEPSPTPGAGPPESSSSIRGDISARASESLARPEGGRGLDRRAGEVDRRAGAAGQPLLWRRGYHGRGDRPRATLSDSSTSLRSFRTRVRPSPRSAPGSLIHGLPRCSGRTRSRWTARAKRPSSCRSRPRRGGGRRLSTAARGLRASRRQVVGSRLENVALEGHRGDRRTSRSIPMPSPSRPSAPERGRSKCPDRTPWWCPSPHASPIGCAARSVRHRLHTRLRRCQVRESARPSRATE